MLLICSVNSVEQWKLEKNISITIETHFVTFLAFLQSIPPFL